MKKKIFISTMVIFLLGLFVTSVNSIDIQYDELTVLLKLTGEQSDTLLKTKKITENQAQRDRKNLKGEPLLLIEAAKRRRQITDNLIENMLSPDQKKKFEDFKIERNKSYGLFILTEGLLLSQNQITKVEIILDEYKKMMEANRERLMERRGGGNRPQGVGNGGMGRGSGGRMRGGMGMRGGGRRPSDMYNTIRGMDSKKAKRIKEILTKGQKKMYKQIRKIEKKKLKQKIRQFREDMGR